MFCLAKQSKNLIESRRLMQTGIKLLLSTRAHPESNTTLKDPVRQVFISQSNDVFTNLALEDWLYKNHDFDHKVRLLLFFDLFKVCIIQLDHICFEKSSSTFWQVHCCAHRTRRSCQKYDEDFFKFCGLLRKPKF